MTSINTAQKYSVYLFIFSLNFAQTNVFNLGEFFLTRTSIFLLFSVALINYKSSFSVKYFPKFINPILLYFVFLTIISYINHTSSYLHIIDFQLAINISTFLILINYSKQIPNLLLTGLRIFAISTFVLSILYFSGIGVSEELEGRYTVFKINMNILGLCSCISLFTLLSEIFENRSEINKKRFLLLFLLPFLFVFMIKTGSRVAFLSFILGILTSIIFNKYLSKKRKILLILFSSFIAMLFWRLFLRNSLVVERLYDTVNKGDLSSRDMIWIKAFDTISSNFLLGIGKTGYWIEFGEESPHNVIIEVLCYTGFIGLVMFLFFFFRIVNNAYKRLKCENELLPAMLIIPILGMILSGQIFDQKIVWIIFAFIVCKSIFKDNTLSQSDNKLSLMN